MYLNVEEVETAIELAAGPTNAAFTERLALPEQTWQGRSCSAIRIHDDGHQKRSGVYFIGGVHAREWGSSDILVHFVQRLTDAYRDHTGITEGGATFTPGDVRSIVRNLDVVVFPQVNPDGRHHSMTTEPLWRKNRRPNEPGSTCTEGSDTGPGVDINRNYDVLWDFETHLHPGAGLVVSDHPCSAVYHGSAAESEPETRNVVSLFDQVPTVRYFIDVHSFGEWILYPWGDDQNQDDTPSENFQNPAWDGDRGLFNDAYGEYLDIDDEAHHITLAQALHDGINDAHGRSYTITQSALLNGVYITTGTANDYAYSRHLADPARPKVHGYTVEWGPERSSLAKSFHPDYSDMLPILEEVTAGLLSFCLEISKQHMPKPPKKVWALYVYILFGVINDGGGIIWVPGKGPVPIDPWGPLSRLDDAVRERVLEVAAELRDELRDERNLRSAAARLRERVVDSLGEQTMADLKGAFVTSKAKLRPATRERLRRASRLAREDVREIVLEDARQPR